MRRQVKNAQKRHRIRSEDAARVREMIEWIGIPDTAKIFSSNKTQIQNWASGKGFVTPRVQQRLRKVSNRARGNNPEVLQTLRALLTQYGYENTAKKVLKLRNKTLPGLTAATNEYLNDVRMLNAQQINRINNALSNNETEFRKRVWDWYNERNAGSKLESDNYTPLRPREDFSRVLDKFCASLNRYILSRGTPAGEKDWEYVLKFWGMLGIGRNTTRWFGY